MTPLTSSTCLCTSLTLLEEELAIAAVAAFAAAVVRALQTISNS